MVPSAAVEISGKANEVTTTVGAVAKYAPNAQVAALVLPVTVRVLVCANALHAANDKAADARRVLVRFFIWFFMVIAFEIKKRKCSRKYAPIGAKSWLVWMPLSRPHQLMCRLPVGPAHGNTPLHGGDWNCIFSLW